jgi:hypothetical protein
VVLVQSEEHARHADVLVIIHADQLKPALVLLAQKRVIGRLIAKFILLMHSMDGMYLDELFLLGEDLRYFARGGDIQIVIVERTHKRE